MLCIAFEDFADEDPAVRDGTLIAEVRPWLIGTPVGLLGVQSRMTRVRSVMAAAIAATAETD